MSVAPPKEYRQETGEMPAPAVEAATQMPAVIDGRWSWVAGLSWGDG